MPARDSRVPYWGDIRVIFVWAAVVFVMVIGLETQFSRLRMIAAGAFLVFTPGYVFVGVLFPRKDQISWLARMTFSCRHRIRSAVVVGTPLVTGRAIGPSVYMAP